MNSRKKIEFLRETKAVWSLYQVKGFDITSIYADKEFKCIRENMRPMELNICPKDGHLHEIERSISTVK